MPDGIAKLPDDDIELQATSLNEVYQRANQSLEAGTDALIEARKLYAHCLSRTRDLYDAGKIRKKIWDVDKSLGWYPQYFSQAGQDFFIEKRFFNGKQFGTFVEIGGYNGWKGSNCLYFEKMQHWTGVVVEASPRLVRDIAKIRLAEVVHAAIADRDGTAEYLDVTAGFTQMGGLLEQYKASLLEEVRSNPKHQEKIVEVRTFRLETLLRQHELEHVDYCSIDVEGAERSILADFDFAAFDIAVLSIENNLFGPSGSLRDILEPAGYRLIEVIGADEIYAK